MTATPEETPGVTPTPGANGDWLDVSTEDCYEDGALLTEERPLTGDDDADVDGDRLS